MRIVALLVLCFLAAASELGATEDQVNRRVCAELGGAAEQRTAAGTRVDCLTDEFAYEADWDHKWAEAIGQAAHYALQTERDAGILFLCRRPRPACFRSYERMMSTIVGIDWPFRWDVRWVTVEEH